MTPNSLRLKSPYLLNEKNKQTDPVNTLKL